MKQKILKIRKLISKALLEEATTATLQLDTTYNDLVINLNARLSALKLQQIAGTIDPKDVTLESNRINTSLLKIVSSIENDMKVNSATNSDIKGVLSKVKEKDNTHKIILVYNPDDASYAEGISSHLFPPIRKGTISIFDIHQDVLPTDDRKQVLERELQQADLVLVLISNHLYKRATQKIALEVEEQVGTKRVIPIKVTPFNMDDTPFKRLQGLPISGKSLSEYDNRDSAMYEISKAIINLVDKI